MPTHTLCFIAVVSLFLGACSKPKPTSDEQSAVVERPAKLKLISYVGLSTNIIGEQVSYLAEQMELVSGGSIRVKPYSPGMIVGSSEILEAVSDGKIDMGYSSAGFWMGKIPSAPLFSSIPFGPDAPEFIAWLYEGNGLTLYQKMYDRYGFDVKVIPCMVLPPETSGWFAKEIKEASDLKGMNMRFYGLGGAVMDKLGVSVSVLSPGEIFPALEKGVLDATEFATPSIDENFGFYKLAKFNYYPGWHQQSTIFELIINRDVWDELSVTQKAVIETVCKAGLVHSLAYGEGTQSAAMKRNVEDRGVTNVDWDDEMLALFKEKWDEVVLEQSAKDPFFEEVFNDLQAFRAEYAIWRDKAYLKKRD